MSLHRTPEQARAYINRKAREARKNGYDDSSTDDAWDEPCSVSVDQFHAYLPQHLYLFEPTGDLWPAAGVNACLAPIGKLKASDWLDQNQPVHQLTWTPGE